MIDAIVALILLFPTQATRPTYLVTNETELRAAAAKSYNAPASTVFIDRSIPLTSMLTFGGDSLNIVGVAPEAELHFLNPWNCDWSKLPPQNGIEINSNAVNIRGVKISDFEWQGSTIKWNADPARARFMLIDRCQFVRCGVKWCPSKRTPEVDDSDSHHSNTIGGHELKNASFVVSNCEFDHCGLSSQHYGHCFYVSARQISIVDCVFKSCGNPFQVGYSNHSHDADVFISGNRIETSEQTKDKAGQMRRQYLYVFGNRSRNIVVGNTIEGDWWIPMTGYFSMSRDVVAYNDWRGARFPSSFATDLKNARYITHDQWKRFEINSLWPTSQPGK